MKYLTIMIADETGKIVDIQNLKTVDSAARCATPVQTSHFRDDRQAAEYLASLRVIYGLPTPQGSPSKRSSRNRVKCWQTGEVFASAAAAARSIGVTTSAMTKHLRNPASLQALTHQRYTFSRVTEYDRR